MCDSDGQTETGKPRQATVTGTGGSEGNREGDSDGLQANAMGGKCDGQMRRANATGKCGRQMQQANATARATSKGNSEGNSEVDSKGDSKGNSKGDRRATEG